MNGNIAARLLTEWYAVLYMQQYHNNRCLGESSILPSAKQSLRCSPPPDQHTPCDPQMSSNRKNAFMSRYATHQQRQRHHNLQLASVAATVLSTNTMMRWRSTTQLPVPLQYITTTSASQRHHSAASITFPNMQARQCADVNETG